MKPVNGGLAFEIKNTGIYWLKRGFALWHSGCNRRKRIYLFFKFQTGFERKLSLFRQIAKYKP
jgi:hypothetical protein